MCFCREEIESSNHFPGSSKEEEWGPENPCHKIRNLSVGFVATTRAHQQLLRSPSTPPSATLVPLPLSLDDSFAPSAKRDPQRKTTSSIFIPFCRQKLLPFSQFPQNDVPGSSHEEASFTITPGGQRSKDSRISGVRRVSTRLDSYFSTMPQ